MKRLLQILLVVLLTSAALAGCMHGDDDDDGTPDPTPTSTPGANNTTPPNVAPIPVIGVSLEADETAVDGPPFAVMADAFVNITFDSNGSSDPDGNISSVSWIVASPSGKEVTSTNATFTSDLGQITKFDFGVYKVTLRVRDDLGLINATVGYFAVDYLKTHTLTDGMAGPGSADRQAEPQDIKASTVHGIGTGTYTVETFPVNQNATAISINLAYAAGTGSAKMKLFLFDASVGTDADTRTADPVNETEPGDSPVSLDHSADPLTNGTWRVRVELVGQRIDSYILDIKVVYSVPVTGDGNTTADNTTSIQMLPLPGLPPAPALPGDDAAMRGGRDGSA